MDWKGASEAAAGATASGTSTTTTTTTTSTLTSSSTTTGTVTGTSLIGLGVVRGAQDKIYHHQHNNHHHQQHKEPTDLSNPTTSQVLSHKRNKPIPPPLDLSIGAANLSLNNHIHLQHHPNSHHHNHHLIHNHHHPQHLGTNSNSANHNLHNNHQSQSSSSQQQQPPTPTNQNQQPYQHHQHQPNVGSPKFTQSDKNLPLRKRWHSWSPTPMNGQDESMVPLFPDTHVSSNKGAGVSDTPQSPVNHQPPPPYHQPYSSPVPVSSYTRTSSQSSSGGGPPGNHYGMQSNGLSMGSTPPPPNIIMSSSAISMNNHHNNIVTTIHTVTTPTPFYTPNEPSPKFMNSPVFSYSNPDTSLYQGPFSPMRASSLYPPPSSPFTNLNLNSPLAPLQTNSSSISTSNSGGGMGSVGNSVCFNMIPSTLLSPAPSQASTNSLSYEDLHEKSLSFLTPAWSVFLPGTKVRFVTAMNSMDWYLVDFLAQSAESLIGLKGEYAPHGLEVRKFVVTSSAKERIQVTFCPVSDPHPPIEVNCEPGHPFMVDKKGWCAIKPDVFLETYGTPCQQLECGDVCMSLGAARSPNQYAHHQQQHHQHNSQVFPLTSAANHNGFMNHITNGGGGNGIGIKIEHESEKSVPISVVPQTQMHNNNHSSMMPIQTSTSILNRKLNSIPISAPASPAKKSKDSNNCPAPGETKGRRPMNAFLLFAKDKRPELIQLYPGKDNRSISVLLGEAWQTLNPVDKDRYAESAKRNAEEQKRMHPDCWKRKRSQSTSS